MRPVAMNAWRGWREAALQGSGLVRTVGPCAKKKVGLNASGHRDALLNDWHESAARFERPAKAGAGASHQALSEARRGLFFVLPVCSSVAMFEQSRASTLPLHT